MLSDGASPTSASVIPASEKSSSSFQLVTSCTGKQKCHRRYESNTTDNASSRTVVRHTTSWRWIIVLGSFGVHFVADGLLFSFGVLMHTIKDDLNVELHTIGLIASLLCSLPFLLAPLCSAMVNKVGCRSMTMLGGFLCSMGLIFASYLGTFIGALIGIGIVCG